MSIPPNILFVLSDQQRFDTINCYREPNFPGFVDGLTPNLDAMAARGVRFRHTFTMQPVCGPARSCLQSGLYATQTGCVVNNRSLPIDQPTIAKLLGAAGYETAYVGKWHLASDGQDNFRTRPVPAERRGGYRDYWMAADVLEFTSHGYEGYYFDKDNRRVDWEGYRVEATTHFVLEYLRQYHTRRSGKPFFMFASFIEPHQQNDLNRYVGPIGSKQRFAQHRVPGDLIGATKINGGKGDWPRHLPDYLGCCDALDRAMGTIFHELDMLGLSDNTLVIYTTDHGCHFCTRNGEYKRSPHEASLRIPLIIQGPGFTGPHRGAGSQGPGVVDELVSLIDLPATVLHAAGVVVPGNFAGRPLQQLTGAARCDHPWPDDVYAQISESQTGRALRTARWKYGIAAPEKDWIDAAPGCAARYTEAVLYDLENDPYELNNLVGEPSLATVRAELASRIKERMRRIGEPACEIVPALT
ncbi:MAG: sulfatase-like hydrolase/transferase [Phycisphaera sp.]|nr:sulfatase-like hydrolase/transferase [Phycisphaera sp.]